MKKFFLSIMLLSSIPLFSMDKPSGSSEKDGDVSEFRKQMDKIADPAVRRLLKKLNPVFNLFKGDVSLILPEQEEVKINLRQLDFLIERGEEVTAVKAIKKFVLSEILRQHANVKLIEPGLENSEARYTYDCLSSKLRYGSVAHLRDDWYNFSDEYREKAAHTMIAYQGELGRFWGIFGEWCWYKWKPSAADFLKYSSGRRLEILKNLQTIKTFYGHDRDVPADFTWNQDAHQKIWEWAQLPVDKFNDKLKDLEEEKKNLRLQSQSQGFWSGLFGSSSSKKDQ